MARVDRLTVHRMAVEGQCATDGITRLDAQRFRIVALPFGEALPRHDVGRHALVLPVAAGDQFPP